MQTAESGVWWVSCGCDVLWAKSHLDSSLCSLDLCRDVSSDAYKLVSRCSCLNLELNPALSLMLLLVV